MARPPFLIRTTLLSRFLAHFLQSVIEMRWSITILLTLLHAGTSLGGFMLLGEDALVSNWIQAVYFYIVSGSSVGYGDFSPESDGGKLFAALYFIPGAISLFALVVGKIVASVTAAMRTLMEGHGSFAHKSGHVVIIGHIPGQTARLLRETRGLNGQRDVVVVDTGDRPDLPERSHYIRVASMSSPDDFARAGIKGAEFIVIMGRDDAETLAACLAVGSMTPAAHVVAYFRDRQGAALLTAHCPEIEIVTSTSVEQVARALSDPGASRVIADLVSTTDNGAALSSAVLSERTAPLPLGRLAAQLLQEHKASLIGWKSDRGPILTPDPARRMHPGETIYYISEARIPDGTL